MNPNANSLPATAAIVLAGLAAHAAEPFRLENAALSLRFDSGSGTLTAIENRLTGETYGVSDDEFLAETPNGGFRFADAKLVSIKYHREVVEARY